MYESSIGDAVTSGSASVIVFATPAFCASRACGPLLDQVKALRPQYQDVEFVHVEIYEDLQVESVEELTAVPATEEWGLPSEPWVFVVDSAGVVSAAFEGAASDEELTAAIDVVAGGYHDSARIRAGSTVAGPHKTVQSQEVGCLFGESV